VTGIFLEGTEETTDSPCHDS